VHVRRRHAARHGGEPGRRGVLHKRPPTADALGNAKLFESRVRRNIRLAEAPGFGQSIFQYAAIPTVRKITGGWPRKSDDYESAGMEQLASDSRRGISTNLLFGLLLAAVAFHAAVQALAIGASLLGITIARPTALGILVVSRSWRWLAWRSATRHANGLCPPARRIVGLNRPASPVDHPGRRGDWLCCDVVLFDRRARFHV